MIQYYEVDPEILDNLAHWHLFLDCFGFDRGRLIKGNVAALELLTKKAQDADRRTAEGLRYQMEGCFGEPCRKEQKLSRLTLNAVDSERDVLLTSRHIAPSAGNWTAQPVTEIPRIDELMLDYCLPVASLGGCLVIIDRWIRTSESSRDKKKKFVEALSLLFRCLPVAPDRRVIIHTSPKGDSPSLLDIGAPNYVGEEERLHKALSPSLKDRGVLKVCRWKKAPVEGFHNRFVLSSFGGVGFGWGLDWENPAQLDVVFPLAAVLAKAIMDRFDPSSERVASYPNG